jgi:hypothetical protein
VNVVCATRIRQKSTLTSSFGSIAILIFIWFLAFFLSSPLILFNRIETMYIDFDSNIINTKNDTLDFNNTTSSYNENYFDSRKYESNNRTVLNRSDKIRIKRDLSGDKLIDFSDSININHCVENSPFHQSRLIYSYVSLLIQYTLPILIVGTTYGR